MAREHRRKGIGSALLRDAGSKIRVIFAEAGNYYTPGVVESDTGTREFFRHHGFLESRWTFNLETRNLPEHIEEERPQDRNGFLRFVEREFGSIWRFEAEKAFEDGERAFYMPNIGFAVHDVNNRGLGTFGPTGVARRCAARVSAPAFSAPRSPICAASATSAPSSPGPTPSTSIGKPAARGGHRFVDSDAE